MDNLNKKDKAQLKELKSPMAVVDWAVNWFRKQSIFMLAYGTGCGAIEIPPTVTARYDAERFGVRGAATPRQADVIVLSGYLAVKTLKRVIRTYEQMQEPKYVIALGSCPINGGMYWDSYNTIKQLDRYLPVDVTVAGCMPRPEAVLEGFMALKDKIQRGEAEGARDYRDNIEKYKNNQKEIFGDKMLPGYTCDWYFSDGGSF
ncbi:MAG: NADH-quinone oxidoreductase subunit NuoB [Spirochaetales bacterium]|nr:NADH-quinone oxidoreductase subunit NuoB [Spirochaetales bacterium]